MGGDLQPASPPRHYNGRLGLKGRIVFSCFLAFFALLFLCICCCAARLSRRRLRQRPASFCYPSDAGLPAETRRSLPMFVHPSSNRSADCSVCLEEFKVGDAGKLIPSCNHGFHAQCIDTWLQSHSTCPLCRSPVHPESTAMSTAIV